VTTKLLSLIVVSAAAAVLACAWVARQPAPPAAHSAAVAAPPAPSPRERAIQAVDAAFAAHDRQRELALTIERALVARDAARRETVFASLLPDLLAADPGRAVAILARLPPGEERDALRAEIARNWVARDAEATLVWIESLDEDREATASIAVRTLAAASPAQAIVAAERLGVGRDDGSVERLVQIWAAERPGEARRWLDAQPDSPRMAQLRGRLPR
jgi:hypothetical protein